MSIEKKCFETKTYAGYDIYDYWNLKEHPLYISFDIKNKPFFMYFDETPFFGSIKVANLTEIRDALYKNNWVFEEKYWKVIRKHIQTMLIIPWTP